MNTNTQIPSDIEAIIEKKRLALLEEKRQKEEQEKQKLNDAQIAGRVKYNEYLQQSILKIPEWIRPYLDVTFNEPDYVRIANRWDHVENIRLYFSIPGLAMIQFDPKNDQWRCETSGWNNYRDDDNEPYLHFSNDSYWRLDVEYVLGEGQREMREHQENLAQYKIQQAERASKREEYLQDQQEREARAVEAGHQRQSKEMQEQAEEQALFDAIKNDAIAIHMLKIFVLLRDERSTFEQRLSDADETMYSIEERWSRKAADLRRQADYAQRRAEDEEYRLKSDLDDAEEKLKKAKQQLQHGW